jgi:hypothetical protein
MIKERMFEEDGKLRILRSQDVQPILEANKRAQNTEIDRKSEMRRAGSIPYVIAEQWSRECGAAIGTKEFGEYAKKKLMDGDWAKLRVRGF